MLLVHGHRKDSNSMDLHDITMNFLFLEMSSIPKYVLIYFCYTTFFCKFPYCKKVTFFGIKYEQIFETIILVIVQNILVSLMSFNLSNELLGVVHSVYT